MAVLTRPAASSLAAWVYPRARSQTYVEGACLRSYTLSALPPMMQMCAGIAVVIGEWGGYNGRWVDLHLHTHSTHKHGHRSVPSSHIDTRAHAGVLAEVVAALLVCVALWAMNSKEVYYKRHITDQRNLLDHHDDLDKNWHDYLVNFMIAGGFQDQFYW